MMTPQQIELARHALGLPNKRKMTFRNHYVTAKDGDDYLTWCQMVEAGDARGRNGSALSGGDPVFWLTEQGARAALKHGEHLDPEDFPLRRAE